MVSWAHRLIAEKITVVKADGNQLFPLPDYHDAINDDEPPPKSVGSTWETHGQLSYIMSKVISLLQDLKDLMVFEFNNENVDNARLFLYEIVVDFSFYSESIYDDVGNPTSVSYTKEKKSISVQNAIAELFTQMTALTEDGKTIENKDYNSKGMMEGFHSIFDIQKITGNASSSIQYYIVEEKEKIEKMTTYIIIAFSLQFTLLHILFLVIEIKVLHKNKAMIYKAITSLPKNVVSKVSDQFKILRKDDSDDDTNHKSDEEYNKQDENMLKLFASSGNCGKGEMHDLLGATILTFLLLAFQIGATVLMMFVFKEINEKVVKAAPNINYITNDYSVDVSNCAIVTSLIGYGYDSNLYQISRPKDELFQLIDYYSARLSDYFQAVRYGTTNKNEVPFAAIGVNVNQEIDSGCTIDTFPTSHYQIYKCSNSDAILSTIQISNRALKNKIQYGSQYFDAEDHMHEFIWHLHLTKIYDQFFYPMKMLLDKFAR